MRKSIRQTILLSHRIPSFIAIFAEFPSPMYGRDTHKVKIFYRMLSKKYSRLSYSSFRDIKCAHVFQATFWKSLQKLADRTLDL